MWLDFGEEVDDKLPYLRAAVTFTEFLQQGSDPGIQELDDLLLTQLQETTEGGQQICQVWRRKYSVAAGQFNADR